MYNILDTENWLVFEHQLGTIYWQASITGQLPIEVTTTNPLVWALRQKGNWGAIIVKEDVAHLLCDQARSLPLLYVKTKHGWDIASDVNTLIAAHPELKLNKDAAKEFAHFGYVIGHETLLSDVFSARYGAITTLSASGEVTQEPLIETVRADAGTELAAIEELSINDFLELFHAELLKAFQFTLEEAKGRQLLVPLSGGADSRLLLAVLKELNAPNVMCFTYGQPGSTEAKISEEVARRLGYDWILVELKPAEMAAKWREAEGFLKATWTGQSLPHIQDWYALTQLQQHPQVEAGAIVLPGHTIVGNEHDEWCAEPDRNFTKRDVVKLYIDHHGVLQGKPKDAASFYTVNKLSFLVRDYWTGKRPENRLETLVALNVGERQAKYISNSVRAYEYFGFDWAFPMYERGVWETWINAPQQFHEGVRLEYVKYANELYRHVSGNDLPYFKGAMQNVPPGTVEILRTILKKTRLLNLANHVLSVRTQLNHPMGFHALVTSIPKRELAFKLARGESLLGIYANLFLANEWVPEADVIPGHQ